MEKSSDEYDKDGFDLSIEEYTVPSLQVPKPPANPPSDKGYSRPRTPNIGTKHVTSSSSGIVPRPPTEPRTQSPARPTSPKYRQYDRHGSITTSTTSSIPSSETQAPGRRNSDTMTITIDEPEGDSSLNPRSSTSSTSGLEVSKATDSNSNQGIHYLPPTPNDATKDTSTATSSKSTSRATVEDGFEDDSPKTDNIKTSKQKQTRPEGSSTTSSTRFSDNVSQSTSLPASHPNPATRSASASSTSTSSSTIAPQPSFSSYHSAGHWGYPLPSSAPTSTSTSTSSTQPPYPFPPMPPPSYPYLSTPGYLPPYPYPLLPPYAYPYMYPPTYSAAHPSVASSSHPSSSASTSGLTSSTYSSDLSSSRPFSTSSSSSSSLPSSLSTLYIDPFQSDFDRKKADLQREYERVIGLLHSPIHDRPLGLPSIPSSSVTSVPSSFSSSFTSTASFLSSPSTSHIPPPLSSALLLSSSSSSSSQLNDSMLPSSLPPSTSSTTSSSTSSSSSSSASSSSSSFHSSSGSTFVTRPSLHSESNPDNHKLESLHERWVSWLTDYQLKLSSYHTLCQTTVLKASPSSNFTKCPPPPPPASSSSSSSSSSDSVPQQNDDQNSSQLHPPVWCPVCYPLSPADIRAYFTRYPSFRTSDDHEGGHDTKYPWDDIYREKYAHDCAKAKGQGLFNQRGHASTSTSTSTTSNDNNHDANIKHIQHQPSRSIEVAASKWDSSIPSSLLMTPLSSLSSSSSSLNPPYTERRRLDFPEWNAVYDDNPVNNPLDNNDSNGDYNPYNSLAFGDGIYGGENGIAGDIGCDQCWHDVRTKEKPPCEADCNRRCTCYLRCGCNVGGKGSQARLELALRKHRPMTVVTNSQLMAFRQEMEAIDRSSRRRSRSRSPSYARFSRIGASEPCPPKCASYPVEPHTLNQFNRAVALTQPITSNSVSTATPTAPSFTKTSRQGKRVNQYDDVPYSRHHGKPEATPCHSVGMDPALTYPQKTSNSMSNIPASTLPTARQSMSDPSLAETARLREINSRNVTGPLVPIPPRVIPSTHPINKPISSLYPSKSAAVKSSINKIHSGKQWTTPLHPEPSAYPPYPRPVAQRNAYFPNHPAPTINKQPIVHGPPVPLPRPTSTERRVPSVVPVNASTSSQPHDMMLMAI